MLLYRIVSTKTKEMRNKKEDWFRFNNLKVYAYVLYMRKTGDVQDIKLSKWVIPESNPGNQVCER